MYDDLLYTPDFLWDDEHAAFDYHLLMTDCVPFTSAQQHRLLTHTTDINVHPAKVVIIGNPYLQGCKDTQHILTKFGIPYSMLYSYPYKKKRDKFNEDGSIFMLVQPKQLYKAARDKLTINPQDIVLIVSGGGDFKQVNAFKFHSYWTQTFLKCLTRHCTTIIGIGHSTDSFILDGIATYCAITPTDAAYYAVELARRRLCFSS